MFPPGHTHTPTHVHTRAHTCTLTLLLLPTCWGPSVCPAVFSPLVDPAHASVCVSESVSLATLTAGCLTFPRIRQGLPSPPCLRQTHPGWAASPCCLSAETDPGGVDGNVPRGLSQPKQAFETQGKALRFEGKVFNYKKLLAQAWIVKNIEGCDVEAPNRKSGPGTGPRSCGLEREWKRISECLTGLLRKAPCSMVAKKCWGRAVAGNAETGHPHHDLCASRSMLMSWSSSVPH